MHVGESVVAETTFACRLSTPDLGARAAQLREEFFTGVETRRELEHGYTFQFPGTPEWLTRLTEFVITERDCCPFFRFELVVEPDLGPIALTITGPAGAKQFMDQTFLPA